MYWEDDRRVQGEEPPPKRRKIHHFRFGEPVYVDELPFDIKSHHSFDIGIMDDHMRAIQRGG